MGKTILFVLVFVLFLGIGLSFADNSTNTQSGQSGGSNVPNASVSSQDTSTASVVYNASCVIDESLQKEINDLMVKLQDAEKSNDTQSMSEIKQKIQALGDEISKQNAQCQSNTATTQQTVQPTTQQTSETSVSISTPTNIQSTTTSCVDESTTKQWTELATQLETAVENNDTELTTQLGQQLETIGQEVLNQMKDNCSSYASNVPLVTLFCPVEVVKFASLEKQLNTLKAQEYQARTAGNTDLTVQLQAQIASLTNESASYTEKCQAKLIASDTAKYFMTSYTTKAYVSPNVTQQAGVITSTTVPTTVTTTTTAQAVVASVCYVPYDLEKKLGDAWNEYNTLVQGTGANGTIDMEKMKVVKETISSAETEINTIKQNCQPTVISGETGGKVPSAISAPGQAIKPGENCTVPVELTQEFEGQWKNYKEALANNDTTKAAEIKAKISEIEQKISSTKGQCVKTIVTENVDAKNVATYYKQKITEVMTQETDTDSQITQLKDLRNEIDKLIMALLDKKNQLNASEVSGVVNEIKIKSNTIQAGSASVSTTTASVSTQINNKNVEIKPTATGVEVKEGALTLTSSELSIKENKVEIAGQIIQTAPSAAMEKAKIQNTKSFNLSVENGTPTYTVKGEENRNLLWVIPVKMEKQVTINASTGNVISEQKPWWSGLTSEATSTK